MADRPILFSAPMIRALLDGRKSQTRRLVKGSPDGPGWFCDPAKGGGFRWVAEGGVPSMPVKMPYAAGDRLWARETFRLGKHLDDLSPNRCTPSYCFYEADGQARVFGRVETEGRVQDGRGRLRASIHMPRDLSRLTLLVTDVRVQRLQDISEADAEAEGAQPTTATDMKPRSPYVAGFKDIWLALHGPDAWSQNPFVAAITFRTILATIDAPECAVAA